MPHNLFSSPSTNTCCPPSAPTHLLLSPQQPFSGAWLRSLPCCDIASIFVNDVTIFYPGKSNICYRKIFSFAPLIECRIKMSAHHATILPFNSRRFSQFVTAILLSSSTSRYHKQRLVAAKCHILLQKALLISATTKRFAEIHKCLADVLCAVRSALLRQQAVADFRYSMVAVIITFFLSEANKCRLYSDR